uniref:Glycine--tRNA ligase beta subunit n=1 Tax=candidate division WOR-3 bacterium TaxID=2052148 RepID=A0A7C3YRS7_UNCW3
MANFLLEIGTEEIPASYLHPATEFLVNSFKKVLADNKIPYKEIKSFFTPRRIAILVKGIKERQEVWEEEVIGPAKKVALNEDGSLTPQGKGFLAANKAKDFSIKETSKGEYLFIKKKRGGEKTVSILKRFLPSLIREIPFPKRMRWMKNGITFARPIRWLLSLFGERILRFPFPTIRVGNWTFGNTYFKKRIILKSAVDYERVLKEYKVIPSFSERRERIRKEASLLAKRAGGEVLFDEELLDEITNTLEFPRGILVKFSQEYLNLPKPVITLVLKKHLRAMAVGRDNNLLPYFIVFANNPFLDKKKVKEWYENSAESRLADANFFYQEDLKKGLESLLEEEKKVIWIEGLGTLYDKTERIKKLVERYCDDCPDIDREGLLRAVLLAKTDLLTNIVREKELTSLQGIMGGLYAQILGEKETVFRAIGEQYLPVPKTKEGALLALADRFCNIVGSFLKGEIPSGSYDPFGLKRMADTIIEILSFHNLFLVVDSSVDFLLSEFSPSDVSLREKILRFFAERMKLFLLNKGYRYDVADSLVYLSPLIPRDLEMRASALQKFREERGEEFRALVIGQKRAKNILREAERKGIPYSSAVDPSLLCEEPEKELYEAARNLEPKIAESLRGREYEETLSLLLSLRGAIDKVFDEVLVMTEDVNLRRNRLALFSYIKSLFYSFCDFSLLVLEGEER